jgi:hypothetical protein
MAVTRGVSRYFWNRRETNECTVGVMRSQASYSLLLQPDMDAEHLALTKRPPWREYSGQPGGVPTSEPVSLVVSLNEFFWIILGIGQLNTQCPNQQENWCGDTLKRKTELKVMNVCVCLVMRPILAHTSSAGVCWSISNLDILQGNTGVCNQF